MRLSTRSESSIPTEHRGTNVEYSHRTDGLRFVTTVEPIFVIDQNRTGHTNYCPRLVYNNPAYSMRSVFITNNSIKLS